MISFESDYIAGAHPAILKRLTETNDEALSGYGSDPYCKNAADKIRTACECPNAQVDFLVGGTQTNSVVISTMLKDYEGVLAAKTGHVSVHEAGAIEYTGHKVLEIEQKDGKINPVALNSYLHDYYQDGNHEHMVFPGMIYLSYPTEYGTLYTKKEMEQISEIAHNYQIPFFVDGARLGYGLMSKECDLTLPELARLCDVFYIGGTKVGALCGEAVVFTKNNHPKYFTTSVKKRGALLAKGRLLGIQFDTLFADNLYFEISKHAIYMAEHLKEIFHQAGLQFYLESPTNQQFIILENQQMETLKEHVGFSFWEKYDDTHTVVRFATSWSTKESDLTQLKDILSNL